MELYLQQWKMVIARGVIAVVFGLVAMIWPVSTALGLVVLWGVFALVDGVASLVGAFRVEGAGSRTLLVVLGVISLLAAFFAIVHPLSAAVTLTWVVGIWLIVRAALEALVAVRDETGTMRWLRLGAAAFLLLAGVLFAANPGRAALAVTFWLGLMAVLSGIAFVVAGLAARGLLADARADGGSVRPAP